ncbi:MAG: hypothetical protein JO207_01285 [Verrucomicrobia bacterium]|nr:hypothetical protein [Verrucomicrobiota bacterium]
MLDLVRKSAQEIRSALKDRADALAKRSGSNRLHRELVLRWERATKKLINALDARIAVVGESVWASEDPESAAAIRDYRLAALPIVEALVAVLPQESQDRPKAALDQARSVLVARDRAAVIDAWNVTANNSSAG